MKKVYIRSAEIVDTELVTIPVTMYIEPIFYEDSKIFSNVQFDQGKWITDNNPSRILNGPLSKYGEELEPPIKEEYEKFVDDCKTIIEYSGFTIIHSERSQDSRKSEYILMFGMNDKPCGKVVFDFRVSDHVLDKYQFPDEFKKIAIQYLEMNKILDGTTTKAGIEFKVDRVTVGIVRNDTWAKALNRLAGRLQHIRNEIRTYQKVHGEL